MESSSTVRYEIRPPPSFALVGKTLAQADSIARTLDPELDPIKLLEDDAFMLVVREAEGGLQPGQLLGYDYRQLHALARLPTRLGQIVDRLETGTLKVGVVPTGLQDADRLVRSVANRIGAASIIVGLLVSSALMARVNHGVALVLRFLPLGGGRPLSDLGDHSHAGRALGGFGGTSLDKQCVSSNPPGLGLNGALRCEISSLHEMK